VDPIPDPLLFLSGSVGNRARASGSVAKNSELSAYTEESFDTFLKWIQNNDRIQGQQITQTNEKRET
jgi:hypothetical protein